MVPVIGIVLFVVLFAAFPLVTRERTGDRGCGMCAVKKKLGLCDGSSCPSKQRAAKKAGNSSER